MKNLVDIIDDTKDNKKPDYEELRYAVLALTALLNLDHIDLKTIEKDTSDLILNLKKKNSQERFHVALNMSPKEWIGWGDDPENPEYQKFRKVGKRIFSNIEKKLRES